VLQLIDGEYGADVQLMAITREQAGFLFEAMRAMRTREGSLIKTLTDAGVLRSTKKGVLFEPTNSVSLIKTSDYDTLDGTNAHGNIFDEVHGYTTDFIKVVNDGSSRKRRNWQTWYLSTNGTVRDAVFDNYYKQWLSILDGGLDDDYTMPWLYHLEDVAEVQDRSAWVKANPMLGIILERESIESDMRKAVNRPDLQAELLAKTFNIPVNSYLSFFTNDECYGNKATYRPEVFEGTPESPRLVIVGIDLSAVNDICSVSFMAIGGDKRYFLNRKYMPRSRVEALPQELRDRYLTWEAEGQLTLHDQDFNKQSFVFWDLMAFMTEHHLTPLMVGYDDWSAGEIRALFEDTYGKAVVHNVPMTTKSLSLGMKMYKELLLSGKLVFNDPVATWNHLNVVARMDANGNVFPNKEKAKNKIDVFMSQLIAYIAFERNKDELAYYFPEA
jgi:phage terminase large subunit-like protein